MSTSLGRWLGDDIAAPMFLDVTSQCQGREFHCYTPPMPRISEATIAEHRRRTETDLLDAWGSLMSEHGYADITLTLVAEHAGVARNTVYGYFADKEALLLAYLDREVARFMEQASAAIRAEESAADRLRVLIELQTRYFAATAASGQELAGVLNPHSFGQMSAAFTPLLDMITQIIQDGQDDGSFREIDVDRIARLVFALLGTYRVALAAGSTTAEQVSENILDLLLHGIARGPQAPTPAE